MATNVKTLNNQKGFLAIFLIFGVLIVIVLVAGAYSLGAKQGGVPKDSNLAKNEPQITPTSIPTVADKITPKPTVKPVVVPSDWKKYTAEDLDFKFKTTMAMPPGFSFQFTGSEFNIQNDSDATELWDYSTSVFNGKDGLKNYYEGSSRREWYRRKLNGEFMKPGDATPKRGEILKVEEIFIGSQSYLVVDVDELNGNKGKHYLYVQNGILHIIKPASMKTYTSETKIPGQIGIIFASLTSSLVK